MSGYNVAYTTEAIFYAQSSYFVTVVMVQWSNVFACKSRKVHMDLSIDFVDLLCFQQAHVFGSADRNDLVRFLVVRAGSERSVRRKAPRFLHFGYSGTRIFNVAVALGGDKEIPDEHGHEQRKAQLVAEKPPLVISYSSIYKIHTYMKSTSVQIIIIILEIH